METQKFPPNVFSDVQTDTVERGDTFNMTSFLLNILGIHGDANRAVNHGMNDSQFARSGVKGGGGVSGDACEVLLTKDRGFNDQARGAGDKTNIEIEKGDRVPSLLKREFDGERVQEGEETFQFRVRSAPDTKNVVYLHEPECEGREEG